jgi:hypothetical protein
MPKGRASMGGLIDSFASNSLSQPRSLALGLERGGLLDTDKDEGDGDWAEGEEMGS